MGLMDTLFGSGAKSESYNQAYPFMMDTYGGQAQGGTGAFNALASLLGLGGEGDFTQGYDQFKKSAGYNNVMDEAMRGVTSSAGAGGMVRSGPTLKAMQDRAAGIGDKYFTNYLGQLGNLSNMGMGAGQLIAGAGGRGEQQGEKGGILGGIASLFSDRRLKRDIELLTRDPDGMGRYKFNYIWDGPDVSPREGVMADEVEQLRPWARGPDVGGYATVDYDRLEAA